MEQLILAFGLESQEIGGYKLPSYNTMILDCPYRLCGRERRIIDPFQFRLNINNPSLEKSI